MDDEEPKTRAASSRTGLLIAMSNMETRFEQLQKMVVSLEDFSGPGLTLIRNELNGVHRQIDRAIAAVEQVTKKQNEGPKVPDRF
jgi:hypothetical protein